jgi:hypothetical protein
MLTCWSSGASFQDGLSVPTDECMESYCVVFACDVLLICACLGHVDFLDYCYECTSWVLLNALCLLMCL